MIEIVLHAFGAACAPVNLMFIALGVALGIVIGALAGLGSVTAMAGLIPVTYYMSPLASIAVLVGINKGGTSGGAIPAILLNSPGTPESAATAFDRYPMARRGGAFRAMKFALFSPVTGDSISDGLLIVLVVPFADFALLPPGRIHHCPALLLRASRRHFGGHAAAGHDRDLEPDGNGHGDGRTRGAGAFDRYVARRDAGAPCGRRCDQAQRGAPGAAQGDPRRGAFPRRPPAGRDRSGRTARCQPRHGAGGAGPASGPRTDRAPPGLRHPGRGRDRHGRVGLALPLHRPREGQALPGPRPDDRAVRDRRHRPLDRPSGRLPELHADPPHPDRRVRPPAPTDDRAGRSPAPGSAHHGSATGAEAWKRTTPGRAATGCHGRPARIPREARSCGGASVPGCDRGSPP